MRKFIYTGTQVLEIIKVDENTNREVDVTEDFFGDEDPMDKLLEDEYGLKDELIDDGILNEDDEFEFRLNDVMETLINMNMFDIEQVKEILLNMGEDDFEVGRYRFIREDKIDEIQVEELECDPYILGCFNAWILADTLGISQTMVKRLQESDAYDVLGQEIIDQEKTSKLQQEYVKCDGYGHHFGTYDGREYDDLICKDQECSYYMFRVN